jgi:hypothetical protein
MKHSRFGKMKHSSWQDLYKIKQTGKSNFWELEDFLRDNLQGVSRFCEWWGLRHWQNRV